MICTEAEIRAVIKRVEQAQKYYAEDVLVYPSQRDKLYHDYCTQLMVLKWALGEDVLF